MGIAKWSCRTMALWTDNMPDLNLISFPFKVIFSCTSGPLPVLLLFLDRWLFCLFCTVHFVISPWTSIFVGRKHQIFASNWAVITGERKTCDTVSCVRLGSKVLSTTRSILVFFCLVMHRLCKVTCKAINPAFYCHILEYLPLNIAEFQRFFSE